LKCRYSHCKHNFSVEKEDAIKEGGSYFHKDCFKEKTTKQEIEKYYIENFPTTVIALLRKAINKFLYVDNYEAEYVLFIEKKVHINGLKINNPYGLAYYCAEGRYITEWKAIKTNIEYQSLKNEMIQPNNEDKLKFTYKPNKKWNDLI